VAALLEAALDLFAEQGYGSTSIPEICARAGLTKGAFYSNFASKDDLFLTLLDTNWQRQAARIRSALPSELEAEGVGEATPLARQVADRRWTLISTEFSLHAIRHPEVAVALAGHEATVRAELAELIGKWLTENGRRATVGLDVLARMVVAGVEGCHVQALTDEAAGRTGLLDLTGPVVLAILRQNSETVAAKRRKSDDSR
jgi:AcrR family transcriptional regulator